MNSNQVLIVEDDCIIALDVEGELLAAGYEVCGIATSEAEALAMAGRTPPAFAVVDVSLSPGDGRRVAKELARRYGTITLFATGECADILALTGTGALGCLPKPYRAEDVPHALGAVDRLGHGKAPGRLPDKMFVVS
jgi:two-component system, response regulator PdtaR